LLLVADFLHDFNSFWEERMIHARDHKTGYIFDPWGYLGSKRRKLLDESWAGLFREHILNELPVEKIAPFFHEDFGRPTKEMYTALGVIMLQQAHDLSDEDTVFELAFNEAWHFALDIPDESDAAKYISPKTLWNLRKIITDNELDGVVFEKITGKLADVFNVDTSKQRLDSVHIKSNMRRLGRIGVFAQTIRKFLINLKRQHVELFNELAPELVEKYLPKKGLGCFSFVKPSESAKRLAEVAVDLFELVRRFADNGDVCGMSSYKLLVRVLEEQCNVTEASDDQAAEVSLKPAKEVSSDSLQNPSDPDAAYDGHKGQGYQVQIMETYSDVEDEKTSDESPNLITYVEVEPANESDTNALMPAIESTTERDLEPEQVLADSLYGSDDNVSAAEENGVKLVAPTMGKDTKKETGLSDFEFSQDGEVTACPVGHEPSKTKRKGDRHTARFDKKRCESCPRRDSCPVKPGKKGWYYLRYNDKALRLAMRRASERSPEFKDRYRYRAGVEATMSELNRKTGVKQLRVRGLPAVRVAAKLKAVGLNIVRAAGARKAANASDKSPKVANRCRAGVYPQPQSAPIQTICSLAVGDEPRPYGVEIDNLGIWSICRQIADFFNPNAIVGTLAYDLGL
jgi:hypothetical protein